MERPAPHPSPLPTPWQWLWRYVVAALVIGGLGLRYYAADRAVAPLEMVNLAFHESSHWATVWAPRGAYVLAGSAGQVLIPLAAGAYLWRVRADRLGGAVGLAWAGLSCDGVARYIADAPHQRLPLVGGDVHDWGYLLGPEQWDHLALAGPLATAVRVAGAAAVAAAVLICVALPVLTARGLLAPPTPTRPTRLPRLLVHDPAPASAPEPELPAFAHPAARP
ncbi:MAG: hypothetical protein KDC33_11770, partial [Thermoleophilia bacterium]|nr:hypothetical protein [Thermoleophilia bacterium]